MSDQYSYEELIQRIVELEEQNKDIQAEAIKYRTLFDSFPHGITVSDSNGKVLEANSVSEQLLGISKNDHGKRKIDGQEWRIIRPDGTDMPSEEWASVLALKEKRLVSNYEMGIVKNNDETIWLDVTAAPISLKSHGVVVTYSNITDRRQAEEALRESEQGLRRSKLQLLVAQKLGKTGSWIYNLEMEKIWASAEGAGIYGLPPVAGYLSLEVVEACIPERERVHKALINLINKGQEYNLEFSIYPADGSPPKEIVSIAKLEKDAEGNPLKVLGFVQDITERKQIEAVLEERVKERTFDLQKTHEQLRKSEERYRQLFNSIRDTILVTDTDRNIIDCNQTFTKVFGYTKEEIIGRKTNFLYDSEDEYLEMGKELKNHLNESHFTYVINYRKKSGEILPGETSAIYLGNDKGQIIGFIGIIRNITYRKMVEESLQQANDELNRKTVELEDTNTALKVLLKKRDQDNQELRENIYSNYELMVTPFLSKLKTRSAKGNQQNLLDIIETNLNEIVAPFARKLSDPLMSLTSSEIQIATMIKQGYSNKEIAAILNSSKRTIDTHRQNIRRKLKLENKKINLKTFLMNL
jgi:two-component system cell cycle sensor histidine kinase/response regulator CckA